MKKYYFLVLILLFFIPLTGMSQDNGPQNNLSIKVEKKDASAENASDAFIKLLITGGKAPYTIHCFSPYASPSQNKGDQLTLKNIKSGDYLFVIQDASGKSETKEVKISNQR